MAEEEQEEEQEQTDEEDRTVILEPDDAQTTDAQRVDYGHEILGLQSQLVGIARAAFRDLPPNARGELICGVRDARFTVGLWINHVGPRLVDAGFRELSTEARGWHDLLATHPHTDEVLSAMTEHAAERVEAESHDPHRYQVASFLRFFGELLKGSATAE